MGRIIGIDLGTTTSEMAYIENGKPKMIVDDMGERIIPSMLGMNDDGEIIFGQEAYNQRMSKNVVKEFKREMGKDTKIKLGDKEFFAYELSAIFLSKLKGVAENYFGEPVEEAVITVPAKFNNEQRQLTKKAGEIAGFKVERIINEPTAAAMAYGINNLDKEAKILVYDFGGGTFDVTILELYQGVIDVLATRGDNYLGGVDVDKIIESFIKEEFKKKYGVDIYSCYDSKDNENKKTLKSRVEDAVIIAKKELSIREVTNISIPFFTIIDGNPIDIDFKLTREKFDELTKDLILRTEKKINEALEVSNLSPEDIDEVLLVGGSSRIAAVEGLVNKKFPNKIKLGINPDEAVSLGAAVQAGIKNEEISSEDSLIVTDKCSLNLGTEVVREEGGRLVGGIFDVLIPIDSSIPCTKKKTYSTLYDDQEGVNVCVYEGQGEFVNQNKKIGEMHVDGIPKGKAGEQCIDIQFKYDLNGILQVTVTISSTGKTKTVKYSTIQSIDTNIDDLLEGITEKNSAEEKDINISQQDLEINTSDEEWEACQLANDVKSTIRLAEKKISKVEDEQAKEIEVLLENLKNAVIDNNKELVEKYDDELTDLLFEV